MNAGILLIFEGVNRKEEFYGEEFVRYRISATREAGGKIPRFRRV